MQLSSTADFAQPLLALYQQGIQTLCVIQDRPEVPEEWSVPDAREELAQLQRLIGLVVEETDRQTDGNSAAQLPGLLELKVISIRQNADLVNDQSEVNRKLLLVRIDEAIEVANGLKESGSASRKLLVELDMLKRYKQDLEAP